MREVEEELLSESDSDESDSVETTSLLHPGCCDGGADTSDEDSARPSLCKSLSVNEHFNLLVTFMIIMNAVAMAVQVDNPKMRVELLDISVWRITGTLFTSFFVLEIGVRLWAAGCRGYFCDQEEWGWNLFDFVVIAGGVGDHVIEEIVMDDPEELRGGRSLLVARIMRILRVLRILRVFRSFRQLRILARGLVESTKMVFWIFVLMLLSIFLCAIICTTIIGQEKQDTWADEEEYQEVREYWGTVVRSMFTLFQFLTMDDWAAPMETVASHSNLNFMRFFFFVFIFFGAFVLMSLLTGVMADHMNDVRRQEEEEERREKIHQREHAIKMAKAVDINGDAVLDRDEFERLVSLESVKKDLGSTGLSIRPREARDLFEWFDVNGDGQIDNEELYHGLKHLFEGITGLQMYKLKVAIQRASAIAEQRPESPKTALARRPPPTEASVQRLDQLTGTLGHLEAKMDTFETQVRAFMRKMGWPPDTDSASEQRQQ